MKRVARLVTEVAKGRLPVRGCDKGKVSRDTDCSLLPITVVRGNPLTSELSPSTATWRSAPAVCTPSVAAFRSRNSLPCPDIGTAAVMAGAGSEAIVLKLA